MASCALQPNALVTDNARIMSGANDNSVENVSAADSVKASSSTKPSAAVLTRLQTLCTGLAMGHCSWAKPCKDRPIFDQGDWFMSSSAARTDCQRAEADGVERVLSNSEATEYSSTDSNRLRRVSRRQH